MTDIGNHDGERWDRRSLIRTRRIQVAFNGIAGFVVAVLVVVLLREQFEYAVTQLAGGAAAIAGSPVFGGLLAGLPLNVAAFVVSFLAFIPFAIGRYEAFRGLKYFRAYPPLWTSVAVAWGLVAVCIVWLPNVAAVIKAEDERVIVPTLGDWSHATVILVSAFAGAVLAAAKLEKWNTRRVEKTKVQESRAGSDSTDRDLDSWLAGDDAAIESIREDVLSRHRTAQRLARQATVMSAHGDMPTMLVVGAAGSGKTSLINLAKQCVHNGDLGTSDEATSGRCVPPGRQLPGAQVLWVEVGAWAYQDLSSLTRAVLQKIVTEIHKEVDAYCIRSLPNAYVGVISEGQGLAATLARVVLGPASDPEQLIDQASKILTMIDCALIVQIDDLDRFRAAAGEQEGDLGSLLDLFRASPRLSFVLADTRFLTGPSSDHIRLANRVEWVGKLLPPTVAAIVSSFRNAQRKRFNDRDANRKSTYIELFDGLEAPWLFLANLAGDSRHLVEILATPRALRGALRLTQEMWSSLHGEVVFDELLAVCSLRQSDRRIRLFNGPETPGPFRPAGAPHRERSTSEVLLIELFLEHRAWLAWWMREKDRKVEDLPAERFTLWEEVSSPTTPEGSLLAGLFEKNRGSTGRRSNPQSIVADDGDRYLSRVMTGDLTARVTDQSVLKMIEALEKTESVPNLAPSVERELCRLEDDPEGIERMCHLASGMTLSAGTMLADRWIERAILDWNTQTRLSHADRFGLVAELLDRCGASEWDRAMRVQHWLARALEASPWASYLLERRLIRRPSQVVPGDDNEVLRKQVARHHTQEWLARFGTVDKAPELVRAMSEGDSIRLFREVMLREWDTPRPLIDEIAASWSAAIPCIIAGAVLDPRGVGAAFAMLLSDVGTKASVDRADGEFVTTSVGHYGIFDEVRAQNLLGSNFDSAMRALEKVPTDLTDASEAAAVRATVEWARKYVADRPT